MLIGIILLILDLHTNIRIDATCICYVLVIILLHVLIRGLTVLSLIFFLRSHSFISNFVS